MGMPALSQGSFTGCQGMHFLCPFNCSPVNPYLYPLGSDAPYSHLVGGVHMRRNYRKTCRPNILREGLELSRIIHNKGPKAERDRTLFLAMYRHLCRHFWVKPREDYQLAKLDNFALDRLNRDIYERQSIKEQNWFNEIVSGRRSGLFKARWFWRDLWHPETRVKRVPKPKLTMVNTGVAVTEPIPDEALKRPGPHERGVPFVNA